tara:strand:+ start:2041 stop:2373 length:333 start_codon:yes stop_codon:yes gene_type:complete
VKPSLFGFLVSPPFLQMSEISIEHTITFRAEEFTRQYATANRDATYDTYLPLLKQYMLEAVRGLLRAQIEDLDDPMVRFEEFKKFTSLQLAVKYFLKPFPKNTLPQVVNL